MMRRAKIAFSRQNSVRPFAVRNLGHSRPDLLILSSSLLDPERTIGHEKTHTDVTLLAFDQEQSAFFAAVEGIHRREQPLALDQPRLVTFIHIKDEHQILGFQIASDR